MARDRKSGSRWGAQLAVVAMAGLVGLAVGEIGLRVIDRNKLKELDAETLQDLLKSDELELIYLQLHSLPNLRVIGERMPTQPAEDTAPPVEADTGTTSYEGEEPTKH